MGIVFFSQLFQFDIRRQYYWNDPEKSFAQGLFQYLHFFLYYSSSLMMKKINDIGIETKKNKRKCDQ